MRVDAEAGEGELGHVDAAHRNETGGEHAGDDRGVGFCRRSVGKHGGTGGGGFSGDIEQILQRDRDSGVAAGGAAGGAQQVGGVRHGAGLLGMDLDERPASLAVRVGDPGEAFLDQGPAGGGSLGQGLGEFVDRAHDASAANEEEHAMTDTPAKPVLLTGASGALGRVLVRSLGALGWRLALTDIAPFPDALPAGATFTSADLSDGVAILRLAEGCGAIIHLGGVSVERPFEEVIGPNIRGLYHIYEAARREKARVIFASSNHSVGFHERTREPAGRYGSFCRMGITGCRRPTAN